MTALRWSVGMVDRDSGAVCVKALDGAPWLWCTDDEVVEDEGDQDTMPDIDHGGTTGEILGQARAAWACPWNDATLTPVLEITRVDGGWRWRLSTVNVEFDQHGIRRIQGLPPKEHIIPSRHGETVETYGLACMGALDAAP